jgi:negative regulator of flagellin synthesis FlgM
VASRIKELDAGSVGAGGGALEPIRGSKPVGAASPDAGNTGGASADSVHITHSARALAALSQALRDTPEVDAARVASLQQAIAAGNFGVDAQRIAGRMLQLEQDLSGSHA